VLRRLRHNNNQMGPGASLAPLFLFLWAGPALIAAEAGVVQSAPEVPHMPGSKYNFVENEAYDHRIGSDAEGIIGVLRVKPSSILWKPKGAHQFLSVPLDAFREWIKANGKPVDK